MRLREGQNLSRIRKLHAMAEPQFAYIDPPAQFLNNAAKVRSYAPEVSGNFLLRSMAHRLGWGSLAGKKIIDFGCGVRFARTLINLGIDVGLYAGIDVNRPAIDWLRANVTDRRFVFEHMDVFNPLYNPQGARLDRYVLPKSLSGIEFDVACMFSVITHQVPEDAWRILSLLHRTGGQGAHLYFTAFVDESIESYAEKKEKVAGLSAYNPRYLRSQLDRTGWTVVACYPPSQFQASAFVCSKSAAETGERE